MKKNILKVFCMALVLCCLLSLAACGASLGKYTLVGAQMDEMTLSAEMLGEAAKDCYLELTSGSTAKFSLNGEVLDMEYADGKIWPAAEGKDAAVGFKVDGNKLYMEQDGIQMVFEK